MTYCCTDPPAAASQGEFMKSSGYWRLLVRLPSRLCGGKKVVNYAVYTSVPRGEFVGEGEGHFGLYGMCVSCDSCGECPLLTRFAPVF